MFLRLKKSFLSRVRSINNVALVEADNARSNRGFNQLLTKELDMHQVMR